MPSNINVVLSYDDLPRKIRALSLAKNDFYDSLGAINVAAVREFNSLAESILRSSIVRPQEQGERPDKRMTGRFTFGGGGTFKSQRIFEPGERYGFGYPDIERADARTDYVWRVLEYGLSGWQRSADDDPQAPRGTHVGPRPWRQSRDIFKPASEDAVNEFRGIRPKRFIRDAADILGQDMSNRWQRAFKEAFSKV